MQSVIEMVSSQFGIVCGTMASRYIHILQLRMNCNKDSQRGDNMIAAAEPMRGAAHMLIMDDRATTGRLFATLTEGGEITTHLAL